MTKTELQNRFEDIFGGGNGEIRAFFAPGRANLIGEHIDYVGGHVLPFALLEGTWTAVRLREDRLVRIACTEEENGRITEIPVPDGSGAPYPGPDGAGAVVWTRYPESVIRVFHDKGMELPSGLDILYCRNIPVGAGLSSAASIEVVTAFLIRAIFGFSQITDEDLADICCRAENEYIGTHRGLMDPFTSVMGKADHAIFLVSARRRYEYVPLKLKNVKIVLTNSGIRHFLAMSDYNRRRTECTKALKKLQAVTNIRELGDLSIDTFNSCKDVIMDETNTKRARHAVMENARTIRAVSALRVGNITRLGELMNQSHISLRDDYEVSCRELDFLAERAWNTPGVIGSRMTGGGFGGCTISLIEEDAVESYKETISEAYRAEFGIFPTFITAYAGDGAREL